MEFTPSIGADGQVSYEQTRGANARWEDTQGDNAKDLVTVNQEANERLLDRAAANLTRRSREQYVTGMTSDEDLDRGTVNPANAYLETKLQEVQLALHRSTNPSEQAVLSAEAERLAAELVNGRSADLPAEEARVSQSNEEIDVEIKEILASSWDKAIATAQEVFDSEKITEINDELLSNEDPMVRKAAAYSLKELASNPEAVTTERVALQQNQVDDLRERYGDATADAINTISQAVAAGITSGTDAFKLVSRDPKLLGALLQEVRSGRMRIML